MYKLLIVDDEPVIIEGIKLMIDWEKYGIQQIATAANYTEAVEKAIELKPHIGIFDVCIGESRGYDIIEKLKTISLPTKYIMISGYDEFEYARRAIRAGARDYLMKPIDKEELGRAVGKIIVEDFHGHIAEKSKNDPTIDPVLKVPYNCLSSLTAKVVMIVKGEYSKNINLKLIAEEFKMNSTYLGQIFLRETHMKFSEYLMAYRLVQAKALIETTTDKISYIAARVGYHNINYFYLHFKDFFGFSPSDLRNTEE